MNIDDMKVGDIKKLIAMFGGNAQPQNDILKNAIGKYCIVRTRNEGINFGKVVEADDTGVVIVEARRIYYHKPKDSKLSWYEGVAETGLHQDSKISGEVSRKYIIEDFSLTVCSNEAIASIKAFPANAS